MVFDLHNSDRPPASLNPQAEAAPRQKAKAQKAHFVVYPFSGHHNLTLPVVRRLGKSYFMHAVQLASGLPREAKSSPCHHSTAGTLAVLTVTAECS